MTSQRALFAVFVIWYSNVNPTNCKTFNDKVGNCDGGDIFCDPSNPAKKRQSLVLTYTEALKKAASGSIGNDVLEAFRNEYKVASEDQEPGRLTGIMVNLAALLLDLGNTKKSDWRDKYDECIELSEAVLRLEPENSASLRNIESARRNLRRRGEEEELAKLPSVYPPTAKAPGDQRPESGRGGLHGVVASLATIPPRITTECRLAIDSLLPQVDRVYLSVSETYERFGPLGALPRYLEEEPYASRVTVTFGADHGSATKYLGSLSAIPGDAWVFFGDDDQEYQPDLVGRMLRAARGAGGRPGVLQNNVGTIKRWCDLGGASDGGLVRGYVGSLVHASLLRDLPRFPRPRPARFVDDQWMAVFWHRAGTPVQESGVEGYKEIFQARRSKSGSQALINLDNRGGMIRDLEAFFSVRFDGWRVRDVDPGRWAGRSAAEGRQQPAGVAVPPAAKPDRPISNVSGKVWQYRREVCTGIGDRIGAMLTLASLASLSRAVVEIEWCDSPSRGVLGRIRSGIPQWSGYNYTLESFGQHFSIPPGVRFVSKFTESGGPSVSFTGNELPPEEGRDQVYTLAWRTTRLGDPAPKDRFVRAYHVAGAGLQARLPPKDRPEGPYVVLHMRGPDSNTPHFFGVDFQHFCTGRLVSALSGRGLAVVLMTNNLSWAGGAGFVSGLHMSRGSAFEDLALLLSADGILQHCIHYSSFSSVPAMARGIPLLNTFAGPKHRYELFRTAGELPAEFHTCQEERAFLAAVEWRVRNG